MAGDAQPVSYVPFRNQLFNTIGCAYAEAKGADTVWYGAAEVDSPCWLLGWLVMNSLAL